VKAVSQRAYARHRGCRLNAVQEAIKAGRLKRSLVLEGKAWKIADVNLADAEWVATTYADRIPLSGPAAAGREGASETPSLNEARARLDMAKAELAEIDLAERRGELIQAQDVEARLADVFSHCKNKLLGIPSKMRQRDPALTTDQLQLAEKLIREALEELADSDTSPKKASAAR
jgi:phage terminase Nu1 subunit (DNA packaging protein)